MPIASVEDINRSGELQRTIHKVLAEYAPQMECPSQVKEKYSFHLAFCVLRGEHNCEFYRKFITQYVEVMKAIEFLYDCDLMIVDVSKSLQNLETALRKHQWVIEEFKLSKKKDGSLTLRSKNIKTNLGDMLAKFIIPELYGGIKVVNRKIGYWKSVESKYAIVANIFNSVYPKEKKKAEDSIKKILQRSNLHEIADKNFRKQMSIAYRNRQKLYIRRIGEAYDDLTMEIAQYTQSQKVSGVPNKQITKKLESYLKNNGMMFSAFSNKIESETKKSLTAVFHITSNAPLPKGDKSK